jgi:hypothetical protein
MERLAAFADVASDARGLPIEQLSKIFDLLAPLFAADPRYPQIRDALDAATAELHGDSEAGARARDRGIALREAGRPVLALRELHEAKIRWFHGDTLRGALLTMIVIAKVYSDLGLPHAAKQYALAAAAAALNAAEPDEVADLVAPAIVQGSITSYNAGAWFDAVALGHIGRMAHAHLTEHAFDYDEHAELTCNQEKATVLAAERLAAAAQVLIADLALLDPVFFPSRIHLRQHRRSARRSGPVRGLSVKGSCGGSAYRSTGKTNRSTSSRKS